ncbi:MAG: DUF554 domain-containing protein [Fimbriimonadaceae bacterium]|jgi:hypothetical protein|nr:DUF554 domain-containing protein [Fimbriimonadaceae bacterium]
MNWSKLPLRGTLLNTTTIIVGSLLGMAIGTALPENLQEIVIHAMGLVTLCLGIKMFLQTKNILVVVASIAIGIVLGSILTIDQGVTGLAEGARTLFSGGGRFTEGLITAAVLYCIGPMTLLGCIQDGIENKIELLSLKSLLDGIASFFLAATLGSGVLVSALVVLIFQGLLTLAAKPLSPLAKKPSLLAEASAVGGVMMVAIGLGLADIKKLPVELFLPALALAPLLVVLWEKWSPPEPDGEPA